MSTLAEIEEAIQRLSPNERAELARWWQKSFDPDEGLELQEDVARELDVAKREIERGEVANWQEMKQAIKSAVR